MRKKFLSILTILLLLSSSVARAQVPATVHATWTPNAAVDNVVQYQLVVDSAAPVITLASVCTATLCSQTLTIPTFGLHTVNLVAQNLKITGDPTSIQSSPPVTITFTLASAPVVAGGFKIAS